MEFKPSFFSITGFLVPGIVLFAAAALLYATKYPTTLDSLAESLARENTSSVGAVFATTITTLICVPILFVAGAAISELFILICRNLILRSLTKSDLDRLVAELSRHATLASLTENHDDAREAFVYINTCGLDLNWYAGRVRMIGGAGLSLTIAGGYSWYLEHTCGVTLALIGVGLLFMVVAGYRSKTFDKYIAAVSSVLSHQINKNHKGG